MNSSKPINEREGFHAETIYKTATEKRTDFRKTQSAVVQAIRSSAGGFFSALRETQALTKEVLLYGIYSFYG